MAGKVGCRLRKWFEVDWGVGGSWAVPTQLNARTSHPPVGESPRVEGDKPRRCSHSSDGRKEGGGEANELRQLRGEEGGRWGRGDEDSGKGEREEGGVEFREV